MLVTGEIDYSGWLSHKTEKEIDTAARRSRYALNCGGPHSGTNDVPPQPLICPPLTCHPSRIGQDDTIMSIKL